MPVNDKHHYYAGNGTLIDEDYVLPIFFFFNLYFFSFLSDLILDKLINDKYSYFDLLGKLNEAFLIKVKFRFAEKTAKSGRKWNSDRRKLRSSGSLITLNSIYWKNLNEHDE